MCFGYISFAQTIRRREASQPASQPELQLYADGISTEQNRFQRFPPRAPAMRRRPLQSRSTSLIEEIKSQENCTKWFSAGAPARASAQLKLSGSH